MAQAGQLTSEVEAPIVSAFLLSIAGAAYVGLCAWVMLNVVAHALLLVFGVAGAALILAAVMLMRRQFVALKIMWAAISLLVLGQIACAIVRPASVKVPLNDTMYLLQNRLQENHLFRSSVPVVGILLLALWLSRQRIRKALMSVQPKGET